MKMTRCPACDREVSQEAAHCPQCGQPIAGRKTEQITGLSALLVMGSLVAAGVLMVLLFGRLGNLWIEFGLASIPVITALVIVSLPKR